jgi:hypothetical protein
MFSQLLYHLFVLVREDTTSLICGHVYHTICINTYCDARGCTLDTIPCPQCKVKSSDIVETHVALHAAGSASSADGPDVVYMAPLVRPSGIIGEPEVIGDDGTDTTDDQGSNAGDASATPTAAAKVAAEGKSKAKAKGTSKAKAKDASQAKAHADAVQSGGDGGACINAIDCGRSRSHSKLGAILYVSLHAVRRYFTYQ